MFENYNDMVTLNELCDMLIIGKSKAYELLRSGVVEGFKEGRVWKIPKQVVIDYVEKHRRK